MEKYFVKRKERSFIRKKDSFIFKKIFNFKTGFCSKIDLGNNRKKLILEGLGGNYFFVHDLRNLQNSKFIVF